MLDSRGANLILKIPLAVARSSSAAVVAEIFSILILTSDVMEKNDGLIALEL